MILSSMFKHPLSFLLIFLPITVILEQIEASPVIVFFCAGLAIIPLAGLLSFATESLSKITGSTIGGLLNATFGNAPELIIAITLLSAGHLEMVRASIFGAIVANLLLALGCAFFFGGLRHKIQEFSSPSTVLQSTMLLIALSGMIAPGIVISIVGNDAIELTSRLTIWICLILLGTYILSLVYMLCTHSTLFSDEEKEEDEHEGKLIGKNSAISLLVIVSILIAFISEIFVGAVEGACLALGMTEIFVGAIVLAIVGGAAESSSAIIMARKNRMNLAVQIALGSSLQIAILIFPLLVLLSYVVGPTPMNLNLGAPGAVFLLLSVLVASMVISEGKSTWYKGVQLIAMYLILALIIYFLPGYDAK